MSLISAGSISLDSTFKSLQKCFHDPKDFFSSATNNAKFPIAFNFVDAGLKNTLLNNVMQKAMLIRVLFSAPSAWLFLLWVYFGNLCHQSFEISIKCCVF
jgi:hypothetical protein